MKINEVMRFKIHITQIHIFSQIACICAKPKNRMRNSVLFLLKCKNRGTLVGPTFFGTFFGQKYRKNSDLA